MMIPVSREHTEENDCGFPQGTYSSGDKNKQTEYREGSKYIDIFCYIYISPVIWNVNI